MAKKVSQRENVSGRKAPRQAEQPEAFFQMYPTWSFKLLDVNHEKWSFTSANDLYRDIIFKLRDYEGQRWNEIIQSSGGRSYGTNNHFENVGSLIKEAQKRWSELHLEEYDQVFSLRLTGIERLYGILENGTFKIIWYDKNHEIYPVSK